MAKGKKEGEPDFASRLSAVEAGLAQIDPRLAGVESGVADMLARFEALEGSTYERIDQGLKKLADDVAAKIDERLDAIGESVETNMDRLVGRLEQVESEVGGVRPVDARPVAAPKLDAEAHHELATELAKRGHRLRTGGDPSALQPGVHSRGEHTKVWDHKGNLVAQGRPVRGSR